MSDVCRQSDGPVDNQHRENGPQKGGLRCEKWRREENKGRLKYQTLVGRAPYCRAEWFEQIYHLQVPILTETFIPSQIQHRGLEQDLPPRKFQACQMFHATLAVRQNLN